MESQLLSLVPVFQDQVGVWSDPLYLSQLVATFAASPTYTLPLLLIVIWNSLSLYIGIFKDIWAGLVFAVPGGLALIFIIFVLAADHTSKENSVVMMLSVVAGMVPALAAFGFMNMALLWKYLFGENVGDVLSALTALYGVVDIVKHNLWRGILIIGLGLYGEEMEVDSLTQSLPDLLTSALTASSNNSQ